MAIYKDHYITLDTKRTPKIALQNIVEGETGNRIYVTVTNDGVALTLDSVSYRVCLRVYSDLGLKVQDSAANQGITFADGKAVIILSPQTYTRNLNRCRLEVYNGDTKIQTAEFQFTAGVGTKNNSQSEDDSTPVAPVELVGSITSGYVASVSLANDAWSALTSVTLDAGTYIITGFCQFTVGTGIRRITLATTADSNVQFTRGAVSSGNALSGVNSDEGFTVLVKLNAQTTLYLNAYQNSGDAMTCYPQISAMRII